MLRYSIVSTKIINSCMNLDSYHATEKIIQCTFIFTVLQVVLVLDILCIQLIMHCTMVMKEVELCTKIVCLYMSCKAIESRVKAFSLKC